MSQPISNEQIPISEQTLAQITSEISRVSVKAPFWKTTLKLWFGSLESQFSPAGVTIWFAKCNI